MRTRYKMFRDEAAAELTPATLRLLVTSCSRTWVISTSVMRVIHTYRTTTGLLGSSFLFHQADSRGRRGRIWGLVWLPLCPFNGWSLQFKHDRAVVQTKGTDRGTDRGDRWGTDSGGRQGDRQGDRQWTHRGTDSGDSWLLTAVSPLHRLVQTAQPHPPHLRGVFPAYTWWPVCCLSPAPNSVLCALSLFSWEVFSAQHKCSACLQVLSVGRIRKGTDVKTVTSWDHSHSQDSELVHHVQWPGRGSRTRYPGLTLIRSRCCLHACGPHAHSLCPRRLGRSGSQGMGLSGGKSRHLVHTGRQSLWQHKVKSDWWSVM